MLPSQMRDCWNEVKWKRRLAIVSELLLLDPKLQAGVLDIARCVLGTWGNYLVSLPTSSDSITCATWRGRNTCIRER